MAKNIDCVNFANYSHIDKETGPDHLGATLPTMYDKRHAFDISSVSLKQNSTYAINDRVSLQIIAHFVKLEVNTEGAMGDFNFNDDSHPDVLRVFVNGVDFRYEYSRRDKICTLKPLDIVEIQFLDAQKRTLFSNIIVIKSIKTVDE